ncbi:MAG: TlpA family protein disulfide reductase [Acidobacteriaceae bacterium]|nr:TlpA family protein disulfide reductase [Acidobacteriaceae bacterium]
MRKVLLVFVLAIPLANHVVGAEISSARELLHNVAERYKNLHSYEIHADEQIMMSRLGQSRGLDEKLLLAVGKEGQFRVEQDTGDELEIRVSDGKITWKALPKHKLWSKMEVAQIAGMDTDEDTDDAVPQDLFARTQQDLVTRYTNLQRYAAAATLEKNDKVKLGGNKVECFVISIPTSTSSIRLYIAKDSLLILRHVEKRRMENGMLAEVHIELKQISEGAPGSDLFEFQPSEGSREVADVSLPSESNASWVGRKAADFTLKTVDGATVHLADLRGKVVLLDFWATWCPPCRAELPRIEAISRKYGDRNVVILGVNDEDLRTVKGFLKSHSDLTTLHDGDRKVHKLYGCRAIPTVLVLDPEGKVVAHFVGGRSESELLAALKQAGMN